MKYNCKISVSTLSELQVQFKCSNLHVFQTKAMIFLTLQTHFLSLKRIILMFALSHTCKLKKLS